MYIARWGPSLEKESSASIGRQSLFIRPYGLQAVTEYGQAAFHLLQASWAALPHTKA